MRLLLLLLLAALTSAAAPLVAFALRPDLVPAGGDVAQGWQDAAEIGRLLVDRWRRGDAAGEVAGPDPFGERRLRTALAVAAAAALWLAGFLAGGLASLALLGLRFRTVVAAIAVAVVLPASCVTSAGLQVAAAPDDEPVIRAALLLVAAALAAGFAAVQGFRRIAV